MSIDKLLVELNSFLPGYDIRLFTLLFLLFILLFLILLFLFKKKWNKRAYPIFFVIFTLIFSVTPPTLLFVSGHQPSEWLNKQFYFLEFIYFSVIVLEITYFLILRIKGKSNRVIKGLTFAILIISFISITAISAFCEPRVLSKTANENGLLAESSSIEIGFTIPINKTNLNINISPETDVEIVYKPFLNIPNWITGFTITPKESFLPDQKIVVYTTGISRIFPNGTKHENSQEFFTPSTPDIEEVVLGVDTNNVGINEPILFSLDSKDQQFVEWEAEFIPETQYQIVRDNSNKVSVTPVNLKQGTDYILRIYRNIIRYNTQTNEQISQESHELLKEVTFKTIPAPGIKEFNRDSVYISNSDPLIVTFENPLKEDTIDGKLSVSPTIEGDISLSEDKTQIIFKPKNSFSKNTEYTFTIGKGIENQLGGYIEQDIPITFKTPGYPKLSAASPWNGAKDLAITTKTISLTFDQPINKDSVQNAFQISPSIDGSFSWKGNTLYYTLSSSLSYGTKYTISLPAGIKTLYGYDSNSTISTSFTTKEETVLLNVPQYYQSESFTCNLAATRMVLAYKGISSTENGIRDSIGIGQDPTTSWVSGYGVHSGPISAYISSRGVSNSAKTGWSLTNALNEVKAGHPILLYVYNGYSTPYGAFTLEGGFTGYKGMHSEVLVGFVGKPDSPQTIITNDPWRGRRYLSPSTFMSKWSYLGYTGIVIY